MIASNTSYQAAAKGKHMKAKPPMPMMDKKKPKGKDPMAMMKAKKKKKK
jgi:hypothetical protein